MSDHTNRGEPGSGADEEHPSGDLSVSGQNREEAPGGHDPATTGGHRASDTGEPEAPVEDRPGVGPKEGRGAGRVGGAGEGTQATGNPRNAG